jgi:hypothetical protein
MNLDQRTADTEAALMKLSYDFAFYMDYHKPDQLTELFTVDALHVHRGRREILEGVKSRTTDVVTRHVSTNFHFTHIDERTVRGVVYNMSYYGALAPEGALPAVYGGAHGILLDFHDLYVLTDDGWRFAERVARPVLLEEDSPLRQGGVQWRQQDYA